MCDSADCDTLDAALRNGRYVGQRDVTGGLKQWLMAFAAHFISHFDGVFELPLAHIIEKHNVNSGYLKNMVELVIDVVNLDGDELGVLYFPRFFNDLF
jgi:hypothetical protein